MSPMSLPSFAFDKAHSADGKGGHHHRHNALYLLRFLCVRASSYGLMYMIACVRLTIIVNTIRNK